MKIEDEGIIETNNAEAYSGLVDVIGVDEDGLVAVKNDEEFPVSRSSNSL